MKLRFAADVRTLLWALALLPAAVMLPWFLAGHVVLALPLALYAGFSAGVLAHYHNHCPVFIGRRANAAYAVWLSIFYGYPIFAWIPTHNANHHKFVNGPGDMTITWRYTKRDTLRAAFSYFFVSAYWQAGSIRSFVAEARARNRKQYRQIVTQYVAVGCAHAAMLACAVGLRGVRLGLLTYACGLGACSAMGLWGMMFINYIQHVHCDPSSRYNHSRNFLNPVANWLVFNSGYHTAHHETAGAHWSTLPALHATIAENIHPELNQQSIAGYLLNAYVLGRFDPHRLPHQIGRPAYAPVGPSLDLDAGAQ
jgi:fatty acid desaturase